MLSEKNPFSTSAKSTMNVGDEYPTFLAFKESLETYSQANSISTYIWDSLKIATARKRGIKKAMKEELVYYSIKYGCVKGGKEFRARGKGVRDTR